MKNRILTLAAATAVLLGLTVPAQAQQPTPAATSPTIPSRGTTRNPAWEFGLGYQWLRTGTFCATFDASNCTADDPQTFPFGLTANAARSWGAFGLVAEVGWSHDADALDDNDFGGSSLNSSMFSAAGGFRFTGRWGRVWPYAEVLGGVGYQTFHVELAPPTNLTFTETRSWPLVQAGGGATFVTGDGWGIYLQVDWRRMFTDESLDLQSGRNDVRAVFGIRMILD
jgi:hypothetical protein